MIGTLLGLLFIVVGFLFQNDRLLIAAGLILLANLLLQTRFKSRDKGARNEKVHFL